METKLGRPLGDFEKASYNLCLEEYREHLSDIHHVLELLAEAREQMAGVAKDSIILANKDQRFKKMFTDILLDKDFEISDLIVCVGEAIGFLTTNSLIECYLINKDTLETPAS